MQEESEDKLEGKHSPRNDFRMNASLRNLLTSKRLLLMRLLPIITEEKENYKNKPGYVWSYLDRPRRRDGTEMQLFLSLNVNCP
jgi:hypothetical protein